MDIKIIFSDIDGTLLDSNRLISDRTAEVIKGLKVPFVLVSSRMPKQMYHLQEKLNGLGELTIAYNGGLIKKGDEIISSTSIGMDVVEDLVRYNEEELGENVHVSLYNDNEWYAPEYDYWAKREENNTKTTPEILANREVIKKWRKEGKGAHKIMLMGEKEYIDKMQSYIEGKFDGKVIPYRSKDTYIEVSDAGIDKLTGIKEVLAISGLGLENVMAFGDSYNDVSMLGNVGWGVAVKNGKDEAKAVSKDVAGDSKENGVAEYLAGYFK